MAKTQQQRDEAAAAKREKAGEVELRHRVRPGILAMLKDLMTWGGFSQLAECIQIIIMNLHAMGPDGAKRFLEVPRHEIIVSANVARQIHAHGIRLAAREVDQELEEDWPEAEVTPKQAQTLSCIRRFITKNGYSPSVAELADLLNITPNAAQDRINILQRNGLITRTGGASRTVRPTA